MATVASAAHDPHPLLIFPCNGNGIEALDCLGDAFRCIGFVDDMPQKQGVDCFGYPVMGREAFARSADALVLAVPGSPTSFLLRRRIIGELGIDARRYATVIHADARVSRLAVIGHNVLIMAGVVITSNAVIGDHVCVLPNTVLHHDAVIGAWSLVGSNVTVAGHVTVGENCYIGSGTSVKNGVRIGAGALIGLGSTVIADVAPGSTVAGNPARRLR